MANQVSVSREIPIDPKRIFAMVSDLPRMGEWSPETTGGRWKAGTSTAAVGAKFIGRNRKGRRRWSTTATVVECDPARAFAFDVTSGPVKVSQWRYDMEPTDAGCRVTETWTDQRAGWFLAISKLASGVSDRESHNRTGMEETLDNLAKAAETDPAV